MPKDQVNNPLSHQIIPNTHWTIRRWDKLFCLGPSIVERLFWGPLLILQYSRFTEVITSGTQSESSSFVSVESINASYLVKVNQISFVKVMYL